MTLCSLQQSITDLYLNASCSSQPLSNNKKSNSSTDWLAARDTAAVKHRFKPRTRQRRHTNTPWWIFPHVPAIWQMLGSKKRSVTLPVWHWLDLVEQGWTLYLPCVRWARSPTNLPHFQRSLPGSYWLPSVIQLQTKRFPAGNSHQEVSTPCSEAATENEKSPVLKLHSITLSTVFKWVSVTFHQRCLQFICRSQVSQ